MKRLIMRTRVTTKKNHNKPNVVLFKSSGMEVPMRQGLAECLAILIVISKHYRWVFLIFLFLIFKEHVIFFIGSFGGLEFLVKKRAGIL